MAANNNHFELNLDTIAPTGSWSGVKGDCNANYALTINNDGTATMMKVWFDTDPSSSSTTVSAEAIASTYTTKFTTEGQFYYHMILIDSVGNESSPITTSAIKFDQTAPTITSVAILDKDGKASERINSLSAKVEVIYPIPTGTASALTRLDVYQVVGTTETLLASTTDVTSGDTTLDITLSGTAGTVDTKTVRAYLTDTAGNRTAASDANTDTVIVDLVGLTATLCVKNTSGSIISYTSTGSVWTNARQVNVVIDVTDASDWAAYRVWGDINSSSSGSATTQPDWTAVTSAQKTAKQAVISMYLTSGDNAKKTIYGQVKDEAGNVTDLTTCYVQYDGSAPTVSLAASVSALSNKTASTSGDGTAHNTCVLTLTYDASISGTAKVEILGLDTTKSYTSNFPTSVTLTGGTDFLTDKDYSITLKVTDNAGNNNTSTAITVKYDSTAPVSGGISAKRSVYNASNISALAYNYAAPSDTGVGLTGMKKVVWIDQTANEGGYDSSWALVDYTDTTAHQGSYAQGDNYYHVKYVDSVGNYSFDNSAKFTVDTVAPTVSNLTFSDGSTKLDTNQSEVSIKWTASDATTGLSKLYVYGDVVNSGTAQTYPATNSINVTLNTSTQGNKNIYIKVADAAGNISDSSNNITANYDTVDPSATLTLWNQTNDTQYTADTETNKPLFKARVSGSDEAGDPSATNLQYRIYGSDSDGDFKINNVPQTKDVATFADVVFDTGKDYMTVPYDLEAIQSSDGSLRVINVTLEIKDEVGNVTLATASFKYQNSIPVVVVSNITDQIISLVHEKRYVSAAQVDRYDDEVNFTFTPDVPIQEWKVCAYENATKAAAETAPASKAAIPSTNGSTNMSGSYATGKDSKVAINCMIKGADYQAALLAASVGSETEHTQDGAHIVVVYAKNPNGVWSAAAVFNA